MPTTQVIRDIPSPSLVESIKEQESNVQDLSLPVYLNNELPLAKPNQPISIQSGQPDPVSVAVVNEQAVQLETGTGLSLVVTSLEEDGTVAPLTPSGAIRLTERRTVVVTGRGFLPRSEAVVWIFSTPTRLGVVPVNGAGKYSAELLVSDELEVGEHTLQVNGIVPNGEIRSMNVALEILDSDKLLNVSTTIVDNELNPTVSVEASDASSETGVATELLMLAAILSVGVGVIVIIARRRRRKELSAS